MRKLLRSIRSLLAVLAVGVLFMVGSLRLRLYVVPAAWLWLDGRRRVRWLAWCIMPVLALLAFSYAASPHVFVTSVRVAAARPPYETPWVLIEGCCQDGRLPVPAARTAELPELPAAAMVCPAVTLSPVFTSTLSGLRCA